MIDHQTTIIREVDSATMAQYGIRLAQAEKAWLVQSDKLYKEIERLRESKRDSVFIHDSIPVPYPVPEPYPVPAELTAWQKFRMNLGGIAFWLLIIGAGIGLFKTRTKLERLSREIPEQEAMLTEIDPRLTAYMQGVASSPSSRPIT